MLADAIRVRFAKASPGSTLSPLTQFGALMSVSMTGPRPQDITTPRLLPGPLTAANRGSALKPRLDARDAVMFDPAYPALTNTTTSWHSCARLRDELGPAAGFLGRPGRPLDRSKSRPLASVRPISCSGSGDSPKRSMRPVVARHERLY
jgi:hypothetical protein